MALSVKQKKFCQLYSKTGNAKQSYIDAGYTANNNHVAETSAHNLLRKSEVRTYVELLQQKTQERIGMDTDSIVNYLVEVVRGGAGEVAEVDDSGEIKLKAGADLNKIEAISQSSSESSSSEGSSESRSISLKNKDKLKALDMLCKILGIYDKRDNEHSRNIEAHADKVLRAVANLQGEK